MASYTLDSEFALTVDWSATGLDAKIQTANFLLATQLGSVPLDRELGWRPAVDEPIDTAEALNTAGITELLQDNIEGLTVTSVTTEMDAINGKMKQRVVIEIDESI